MTKQDELNKAIWKGEQILEAYQRMKKRKEKYRKLYLRYKRKHEELIEEKS